VARSSPWLKAAALRIPVRDYLNEILPGLADKPIQQVADLTPAAWLQDKLPTTYKTNTAPRQPCAWPYAYDGPWVINRDILESKTAQALNDALIFNA